ncbi:MAG: porin [bacterium]
MKRKVTGLVLALALLAPMIAGAGNVSSKMDVDFYGYIKLDAVYQSSYSIMDQYLVYVPPGNKCGPGGADCVDGAQDNSEQDTFHMTARQSRFGFLIKGPESDDIKSQGRFEMDFYGDWPAQDVGKDPDENKGMMMLRRAYVEIMGENWSVLAGNEWMVVSPMFPHVNNYPYGADCGNLGYRMPQIRLTGYALDKQIMMQVAAVNKIGDVEALDIDTGRMNAAPTWEAGLWYKGPFTVALTGHYGQEEIKTVRPSHGSTALAHYGSKVESYSYNVSLNIPLGDYFAINGEWFQGANLDGWYTGGVQQGWVETEDGDREALETTGGWAEIMIKPSDKLKFYVGYGVDDPDDDQLENGTIEPGYADKDGNKGITKNSMMYGNVWFNVNESTMISFEYMQMTTEYDLADKDSGLDYDNGETDRYTLSFWYMF